MKGKKEQSELKRADYRHVYPVFGLVVAVLAVAGTLRAVATPASFGQFGLYRGAAVLEARAPAPRHQGEKACAKCHFEQVQLHDKDSHAAVECEACHGQGQQHALRGTKQSAQRMKVSPGKAQCLVCHQQLSARPSSFPQIDWRQHYEFVGVEQPGTPCMVCHHPHEPLFMDRDLRTARLHPVVHRCRDCHQGSSRDPAAERPEGHPPIFECRYCHAPVATDFAARSHRKLRCSTCHLFFKQSEDAGRIIRDADPRFCLLCHRGGDFRSDAAPPSIEWPKHREDVGKAPQDQLKRCVDCHQDKIHIVHEEPGDDA